MRDFAPEDADVGLAREFQPFGHFRQIVGQRHAADRHGDHARAMRSPADFVVAHGRIAGAEINGIGQKTFDAGPAADRFVSDDDSRILLLVLFEPVTVERRGETSPRPPTRRRPAASAGTILASAGREQEAAVAQSQRNQKQRRFAGHPWRFPAQSDEI